MRVIIDLTCLSLHPPTSLHTYVTEHLDLYCVSERRMSMTQSLLTDAVVSQTYISISTFPLLVLPSTIKYPNTHGYNTKAKRTDVDRVAGYVVGTI